MMKLSRPDRLMLSLQLRILEHLEPKEAERIRRQRVAIEAGYEDEYDEIAQDVSKDTLSREECSFVKDVLHMFDVLQRAQKTLPDGAGMKAADVQFPGFDGNNETIQFAYARYIMQDKDQYGHLDTKRDINSHSQVIELYRRMLEAWDLSGNKYEPTRADLERIIAARIHPDRASSST